MTILHSVRAKWAHFRVLSSCTLSSPISTLGQMSPHLLGRAGPFHRTSCFSCTLRSLSLLEALSSLAVAFVATALFFTHMAASVQDQPKGEGRAGADHVSCESYAAQQWTPTGKSRCGPQESPGEWTCATSWHTGMYTVRAVIQKILVWA